MSNLRVLFSLVVLGLVLQPAGVAGIVPDASLSTGHRAANTGGRPTPPPPAIRALSRATGSTSGGIRVTLTGTNFTGATAVRFGDRDATAFTVDSSTSITAVAPAGTGAVDVTVITHGGSSTVRPVDPHILAMPRPIPLLSDLGFAVLTGALLAAGALVLRRSHTAA